MENKKILSLRTKAEALIIVALLFGIGISNVMSLTRTITDDSDTIYTRIMDSNGNTLEANESNLIASIADVGDSHGWVQIPSMITISATLVIPSNLTLKGVGMSSGLYLADGSDCAMMQNENFGDWTDTPVLYSDSNITIENMVINQNDANQAVYTNVGNYALIYHAIRLFDVQNITIQGCKFIDIVADGVDINVGDNINIDNNEFYGVGRGFDAGTDEEVTTRCAYFYFCSNFTFNNNICKDLHCSAVGVENWGANTDFKTNENFVIANNVISDCWNGIWLEANGYGNNEVVRNGVISGNTIYNFTYGEGYRITNIGQMNGIAAVRYTENIDIIGNTVRYGGNLTEPKLYGKGIWARMSNGSVVGNTIENISGYGIECYGDNIISDNSINNCTDWGIFVNIPSTGYFDISPIINGNKLTNCEGGIYMSSTAPASIRKNISGGIVSNNIIEDCITSTSSIHGIWNKYWNMSINENIIDGGYYGILNTGSYCKIIGNTVSGTGQSGIRFYDGGNPIIRNIVSFNEVLNVGNGDDDCFMIYDLYNSTFIGNIGYGNSDGIDHAGTCDYNTYIGNNMDCDDADYDINSANYKPTGQTNFTNFNTGTWT